MRAGWRVTGFRFLARVTGHGFASHESRVGGILLLSTVYFLLASGYYLLPTTYESRVTSHASRVAGWRVTAIATATATATAHCYFYYNRLHHLPAIKYYTNKVPCRQLFSTMEIPPPCGRRDDRWCSHTFFPTHLLTYSTTQLLRPGTSSPLLRGLRLF